jgi:cell division transport system permease protein
LLSSSRAVLAWLVPALILLTFVGALLAILGAAAIRQASHGEARLTGAATVVVWGRGLESPDAAQARAAEILSGVSGVERAAALDPLPDDQLVAQAMGAPAGTEARLVSVRGSDAHLASRLAQTLRAQGLAARTADPSDAASSSRKTLLRAVVGDVVLPLLVVVAMIAVCAGASRREAALARPTLELIRQFGAADGFVPGLWRRRCAARAIACAVVGAAAAVLAALAWQAAGGLGVALEPMDLIWAAPWVAVTGLIGGLWSSGARAAP